MAILAYADKQIIPANTSFFDWVQITNNITSDMNTIVVSIGDDNVGNVSLDGTFTSNQVEAGVLRAKDSTLQISSNTIFQGGNTVSIHANTNFSVESNVSFVGSGKSFVVDNSNTSIKTTNLVVDATNTTFTGPVNFADRVELLNLAVTGNLEISSTVFTGNTILETLEVSGNVIVGDTITAQFLSAPAAQFANFQTTGNTTVLNLSSTGTAATRVSVGTTAQRPTPQSGMIRFNTSLTSFEGYNGSSWSGIGGTTVADDTTTDQSRFLTFVSSTSGTASQFTVSSTKLFFNPSTGTLNATDFNSLSDVAYKENIQPLSETLIDGLNPVQFTWKDTGKSSYGLIAQELEAVLPELVTENGGVKSVSYIPLIAILIQEVKTLRAELNKLKV
jgi:hypothetical protein